jgi:hypothetical protein
MKIWDTWGFGYGYLGAMDWDNGVLDLWSLLGYVQHGYGRIFGYGAWEANFTPY